MTEDELAALIERNEVRKRNEAHWRKYHSRATDGPNSIAADDIDQLLALVADLQSALVGQKDIMPRWVPVDEDLPDNADDIRDPLYQGNFYGVEVLWKDQDGVIAPGRHYRKKRTPDVFVVINKHIRPLAAFVAWHPLAET